MLELSRSKTFRNPHAALPLEGNWHSLTASGTHGGRSESPAGNHTDAEAANGFRAVILEADDLGLLYAFNEGIRRAFRAGALTSSSLRANGYAYEHAVQEIIPACDGLGVGVHLCLNEAGSVAPREQVPLLVNDQGSLYSSYLRLIQIVRTPAGREQIERECRAQIEKVLGDGVVLDHLNSHRHVHMIPEIFRITCRLAQEYRIPCVRLVRELPHTAGGFRKRFQPLINSNYIKRILLNRFARENEAAVLEHGIPTTDYFVGVSYTSNMNLQTIIAGLRAVPNGSVEVLLHPATGPDLRDRHYPGNGIRRYVAAPQRRFEAHALSRPELSSFLQRERWVAMNYSAWAGVKHQLRFPSSIPAVDDRVRETCRTVDVSCPPWVSEAQDDSRVFAQLVISQVQPGQRVLDMGTGTGILAISLARLGHTVVATDISAAAVKTAQSNAARNGVSFECCCSDLLDSVPGSFDWIAFNLPYGFGPDSFFTNIAKHVLRRIPFIRRSSGLAMPRTVLRYHQQIVGRLVAQAPARLTGNGGLILHAYESEVSALASVLPRGANVEILHHPDLTNRTVGMVTRMPS